MNKFDREQVRSELELCQDRIAQTLVPTIIAVGLISIADRENIVLVTLSSSFSVLFASSLYVASLSYKIFRNTTFIQAINELHTSESNDYWWGALMKFNDNSKPPLFIGFETRAISVVYFVFAIAFIFMFYDVNPLLSIGLGLILISVAARIFLLPKATEKMLRHWRLVINEMAASE